jgi:hypothetical protein
MLSCLSDSELNQFRATLEAIDRNAQAQCEREHAEDELRPHDRPSDAGSAPSVSHPSPAVRRATGQGPVAEVKDSRDREPWPAYRKPQIRPRRRMVGHMQAR